MIGLYEYRFDSFKMSDDILREHIQSYIELGWEFIALSNFPPPHKWIHLSWNKDTEPIFPNNKKKKK